MLSPRLCRLPAPRSFLAKGVVHWSEMGPTHTSKTIYDKIAMRGKLVCKTVLRGVLRPGVLTSETINGHGQFMSRLFFANAAL